MVNLQSHYFLYTVGVWKAPGGPQPPDCESLRRDDPECWCLVAMVISFHSFFSLMYPSIIP